MSALLRLRLCRFLAVLRGAALAVLCLALLSACSVFSTAPVSTGSTRPTACGTTDIAYFLPKRLLEIKVVSKVLTIDYPSGTDLAYRAASDRQYGAFCFTYQGDVFADEHVDVEVDSTTNLLTAVKFNARDRTASILSQAAQALSDLAASSMHLRAEETLPDSGPYFVDPFDQQAMDAINDRLKGHFCVFLDPANDPVVPAWSGLRCRTASAPTPALQPAMQQYNPAQHQIDGLVYRPLMSHRMVVMASVGGKWQELQSKTFELPNASPIFVLHIDRSWLGDSSTVVSFDQGIPYDITRNKQSEISVAGQITVSLVQSVLSIPAKALDFGTNDAKNQQLLIAAQDDEIQAYLAWISAKQKLAGTVVVNAPAQSPDLALYSGAACKGDTTIPPEACAGLAGSGM